MTTISTLLGAIPLVLSSGAGAESRYSMAIVFGGITLSALITLYLFLLYRFLLNLSDYFNGGMVNPFCIEKYTERSSIS